MDIKFNKTESRIIDIIKKVSEQNGSTARIAGGYVRDKLLGLESNDIDISIDNMSGKQFAELVNSYMEDNNELVKNISVIKSNPDQSKHLETATVSILGLPIDFVNLRSESYTDSRIPSIKIGTPQEDAERRDLTINALFYNINTNQIEDFVGGINDLKNRVAKTPLNSIQTFLDDPLRILRTIRFAARFNLKLDPSIIEAANCYEVQLAFKNKISKERIWAEIAGSKSGKEKWKAGSLCGNNPVVALKLLKELGLFDIIFETKMDNMIPWDSEQKNSHHEFTIWGHTLKAFEELILRTEKEIKQDKEVYIIRNISCILHDIGKRYKGIQNINTKGDTSYHGHEMMSAKISEEILNNLHAPTSITKRVIKLVGVHLMPHILKENSNPKSCRKFIRDFEDWNHSIDLAISDHLGKKNWENKKLEVDKYEKLRTTINNLTVDGKVNITRPITGYDLIQINIPMGPMIGKIMKQIDEELLSNPQLTKEEAIKIAESMMKTD
jgi:tRNA nucleotidyltransferase/poly(A) polymerase